MSRPRTGTEFASIEKDYRRGAIGDLLIPTDSVLSKKGGSYQVYDSLLTDDQVKSTFQQRRGAVTSCDTEVTPASESAADKAAADFIREQLEALDWYDVTDKMLYGNFYGFTVAELIYALDGQHIVIDEIKVRDRSRFRYGTDGSLRLITIGNLSGEIMDDRYFWHYRTGASHSDEPYGRGLAHYLYWPVFFKRTDMKFWLVFLEKFGSPALVGKMPRGKFMDESYRKKVIASLEAIRQDSVSVLPDDVEYDLLEATRSGTADYADLDKRMDMRIAKIVLSQTLTTEAVGGQYKGDVHKEVRDEVIRADARQVCESFNRQVVARLTAWNFPSATPPIVSRKTEPEEDTNTRAERDTKVYELGFEPTEEYVTEHYGEGWVKRKKQAPPPDPTQNPQFSELVGTLLQNRNAHRLDQDAIKRAGLYFAEHPEAAVGERVHQLLQQLDESGDLAAFSEQLAAMIEQPPPEQAVKAMQRVGIIGRLLGALRGQRDEHTTTTTSGGGQ